MTNLEYVKLSEQKRSELAASLRAGEVADPITLFLISVGISVGVSFLSRALAPKPPMQQVGLMQGTVQIQNSSQGTFIPEIYGGAPEISLTAGSASSWTSGVDLSFGSNGKATKNAGTDQVWNAGAVHNVTVSADEDAFIEFTVDGTDVPTATFAAVALGFSTDDSPESGAGVGGAPALEFGIIVGTNVTGTDASSNPIVSRVFKLVILGVGGLNLGSWNAGDTFRVEKRSGVYHVYHDLAEVSTFDPPVPSSTLYLAVSGWRTGYGVTTSYVKIGGIGLPPSAGSGGCKVPAMTVWAVPPLKHSYVSSQPTQGGKGHPSTPVENIYYTIDWRLNFGRGPLALLREYANTDVLIHQDPNLAQPSGVYNPATSPSVYDPLTPPDPIPGDDLPIRSRDGDLLGDGIGGSTGTIQQGTSGIAVYEGSSTQDVDPTEEAAIDAAKGPNSTPAHRDVAGIVHTGLSLQRWQNIPPNVTAVWQHKTLKLLGPIYESLCGRIKNRNGDPLLTSDDYDFSSIANVVCRGMLLDGRRFSPSEIFDNEEIQDFYNYFTTEGDGKILAYVNGDEPSITIPETSITWIDGASSQNAETFPTVSASLQAETQKPRQINLKYINQGNDWEPDDANTQRKVTDGNLYESLQVQVTGNPDEARTATERRLYRKYVGDPVKFTLSWEYLYLFAGYRITVHTIAGITYVIRLTKRTGGLGVQDCEGILLEPASFSQSAVGSITPTYNPAHPKPAASILAASDVPAFRPEDNLLFGEYFSTCPRVTDLQTWNGAALFIKRGGTWVKLEEFPAPAIMGRIASITGTLGTDPSVTDSTSTITVDLYGTKALLESVTEANMIAGLNRAVCGLMILGFAGCTRVADYPNRWDLTTLRNGQNATEDAIPGVVAGQSFVVLNQAVKFVQFDPSTEVDTELHLKAVSLGQSLPDAAELITICSGRSVRMPAPTNFTGFFDTGGGDILEEWAGVTPRFGVERYELQHLASDLTTILGKPKIIDPIANRHLQEYVIWDTSSFHQSGGLGTYTILPNGGISISGSTGAYIQSSASAEVVGGFLIEFQIPSSAYIPAAYMSLFPEDSYGIDPVHNFSWGTGGSYPNYTARPEHDFSDSPGPTINITAGDRLGIYIRPDGVVEYHVNYTPTSKPIFTSAKSVQTTQKYFAYVEGGRIEKVSWLRQGPEFKYVATQQRLDNSLTSPTLPSHIYGRVRQLSPFDQGQPSPWTYFTLVRP